MCAGGLLESQLGVVLVGKSGVDEDDKNGFVDDRLVD